jgi:membrane-associated phospholipid phosphatase
MSASTCAGWLFLAMGVFVCAQDTAPANEDAAVPPVSRDVSWKTIAPNFVDDQKAIWSFPAHLARGSAFFPTVAVLGATAGLTAVDPIEGRYFRANSSDYHPFNRIFSGAATTSVILATPAALYFAGLGRGDSQAQRTALLSAEAMADVEVVNVVLRLTTRRLRPTDVPPQGNFSDTWFDSGANPLKAQGSFASGHAASAFALATVVARQYPHHRWIPVVAYGAAGLFVFSRVSSNAHFLSDAFFGSALGYTVGRFVVLRQ